MSEILEYLQRLNDDRVAFPAFDMGDKAQAAGVVLVARVVQALFGRWLVLRVAGSLIHVVLTAFRNDKHVDPTAGLGPKQGSRRRGGETFAILAILLHRGNRGRPWARAAVYSRRKHLRRVQTCALI
jgi:hypothetical protein